MQQISKAAAHQGGHTSVYGARCDKVSGNDPEMGSPVQMRPEDSSFAQGVQERDRANFIRKVYGILSAQMALTFFVCFCAMYVGPIRTVFLYLATSPAFSIVSFAASMAVLCALPKYKAEHPTNYILLLVFTVLQSFAIAGVCAMYQKHGLGLIVLEAFFLTGGVFVGLSLYALKSGQDFTWMGGMLAMGLMGMLAFMLFGSIFGFHGGFIFSLFGTVLFSGFILYDTSVIMKEYGPDQAIEAAVNLYLDIINLFLYILQMLSEMQGSDS